MKNLPQTDFISNMGQKIRDLKDENAKLVCAVKEAKSAPNNVVEVRTHQRVAVLCGRCWHTTLLTLCIFKERNQLQQRIREVLRANKALQEDNVNLGSKIEELSSEVISSRALIDKLLKTSHDTQTGDWEKKEAQYRSVIRNYQQQIRKQASTVSLELYKAVIDESKRTQTQLQDAEKRIIDLQSKVTSMEKEGIAIGTTKTPNKKAGMRNHLLSPTDRLEKGLLTNDYQQVQIRKSPYQDITFSAKKLKTPLSKLDLNLTDNTMTGRKAELRLQSPTERFCLQNEFHASHTEHDRTPHVIERTTPIQQSRQRDDLTGMTICFQTPTTGLSSPGEHTMHHQSDGSPLDVEINNWVDRYNQEHLESKNSNGPSKVSPNDFLSPSWQPTPRKRPVVAQTKSFDGDSTAPVVPMSDTKENQAAKNSPKSASKTLRMRKARELGGMKGLRSQLNKIRSPQSLGKPKRVVQVLGDRQVN